MASTLPCVRLVSLSPEDVMIMRHLASPQSGTDAQPAARSAGTTADGKAVKRTVIQNGKNSITITEDQNGNKTITGTGASNWLPALQDVPGVPPLPGVPPVPAISGSKPAQTDDIPPRVLDMGYALFLMIAVVAIGTPIARAFGRRIDRKGDSGALAPASTEQLRRIEQAVEAMAIEVERISESQRFMAKLQNGSTAERV